MCSDLAPCHFFHISRAAYDTSASNAKRKFPEEGEADEEEIEEYKVRRRWNT